MNMASASRDSEYHPWDRCDEQPCRYSYSQDPDWLADMADAQANRNFHRKLWKLFRHRSLLETSPDEELEKYKVKFARCQRIMAKREQILVEIRASRLRRRRETGTPPQYKTAMTEAEIKALRDAIMKKLQDVDEMKGRTETKSW